MDSNIESGYSAEYAASVIAEAIMLKEREVVIAPWYHKTVKYVRHLLPGPFAWAMVQRYRDNVAKAKGD